ncbi:MAG: hypothetical protein ACYDH6_06975 [Acidimicrobiales bacterium]
MSPKKQRVTVTLDPEVIRAANRAVAIGQAESVSEWINTRLGSKVDHERRMAALGEAIAAYEAEFGAFTPEELEESRRRMEERAIVIRGGVVVKRPKSQP